MLKFREVGNLQYFQIPQWPKNLQSNCLQRIATQQSGVTTMIRTYIGNVLLPLRSLVC